MSYSASAAIGFSVRHPRHSSRRDSSHQFFGSAAIACVVVGCAWAVYANVLGASIYPTISTENFDAPVIKRMSSIAVRNPRPVADNSMGTLTALDLAPSGTSLTFAERFAAAAAEGVAPRPQVVVAAKVETPKLAEAPKLVETPKLAEAPKRKDTSPAPVQLAAISPSPAARLTEPKNTKDSDGAAQNMAQRAKAAVMSIVGADKPSIVEKLWGKPQSRGSLLAYASADASITGSLGQSQNPALGGSAPYDRATAVYDISAHTVYLPDGTKLEAHSGLGSMLDDPRHVNVRMHGATPPHIYELTPREALFHGVPALRMNPIGGEDAIFGRSGLLAHTYMLGPNGDSNGCVSFKDYDAFLNAYRNQGIKRLAVVARVE
ncbi:MAG TPA: tlde1 domain-containing protein [Bradyrhizobium sp.]|nr:tlde1 domain-containing protein [Bradyrhizobium sp.]